MNLPNDDRTTSSIASGTARTLAEQLIRENPDCRVCKTKLDKVLDLGMVHVVNMGDKDPLVAPLVLGYCPGCTLLQLMHTVDPAYLFGEYYYLSGVNEAMVASLLEISKQAQSRASLKEGDIVVDIGCNDGTLLRSYPDWVNKVGFDPAKNIETEDFVRVLDFFSAKGYGDVGFLNKKAKVITAISCFYDLDDPNAFLEDITKVLDEDGLFIVQQNYLPQMLENNAFDNIVHEHLEYYSVTSMQNLLGRHRLYIQDVEFNDVNGGSFRTYIRRMPQTFTGKMLSWPSVEKALEREKSLGLDKPHIYKEFAARIQIIAAKIKRFVESEAADGKVIYLAGASTRGYTLIQVCGLDSKTIKYVVERNPAKYGKVYGKTGIEILSEALGEKMPPDYYLILPWQFAAEFFIREQSYLRRGGKILFPLPKPAVVEVKEL